MTIGVAWLACIYYRGQIYLPEEKQLYFQKTAQVFDYSLLREEMQQAYRQQLAWRGHQIIYFWTVVIVELFCALLYIASGLALFRRLPLAKGLVNGTILIDITLKFMVVVYQAFDVDSARLFSAQVYDPLTYFIADGSLASKLSGFLTGAYFAYPTYWYTLIIYAFYLCVLVMCFNNPVVVQQLKK